MNIQKIKSRKGITLISLIVIIIILLIIVGITIMQLTHNELVNKAKEVNEDTQKQTATETMNLKITNIQISSFAENQQLPSLQFLADKLCDDEDMEYVLTQSKLQSSLNKIDASNIPSIFTKLKEYPYEFEINSSLQLASINGIKVATGPQIEECSRYIEVTAEGSLGNLKMTVDIPEKDDKIIKKIDYYIDNKLVHSGLDKVWVEKDLETEKEYEVYAIVTYKTDKLATTAISKKLPPADIYVLKTGNDSTGDGSANAPYATVDKALTVAASGNKVYIGEGTYELKAMIADGGEAVGIFDSSKKLEIFGANEKTILSFKASSTTTRASGICLRNAGSIVRNLVFEWEPKKSGANYEKSLTYRISGNMANVFFRFIGSSNPTIFYGTEGAGGRIDNCTFFCNTGAIDNSWDNPKNNFYNTATNVSIKTGVTNSNMKVESYGVAADSITTLINSSKDNTTFNTNHVGVFYGTYAWE